MQNTVTPTRINNNVLLYTKNISQRLVGEDKQTQHILDNINFTLYDNEIVAILGKSGAGKSTFLRTIAGLLPASSGKVYHQDTLIEKPIEEIAMVFQSFALLPWLTVLDNVCFGLDAQGMNKSTSKAKALKAIQLVGLAGYEHAYSKELSGGMRQRVGFARALVVEPKILLMDEPFSALDIGTASTLRKDIIRLWQEQAIQTRSMVIVTHSVEEAVTMADRVIVFDHHPGRIAFETHILADHPRDIQSANLREKIALISEQLLEGAH
ncbi:Taurine import ATP-binding protein TauB [Piscirickettsia salmonis]|uniref:ABC transporter ATP-binding protein n=1 Tax=Piscirickettsia salmonis TaxID=1238 RepID=UPI0012B94D8D|nr:ABC transporter ATP-binding protein [Piscirickettsia salmonis]QGP51867.1 Taurine import ATP-binding protein TauB [Piscirickettsia salmonis]QGP52889.1 Taurine import ATP-binding protein TauB [Piscirickettsia salmonis]QGP61186.1 Taurine import ATP-binding protein TauB [Piscirickettsia salmonis]QGP62461.1 Taurine import ATP-binding protein TauB [Piscirickettsia salmonis]